MRIMILFTMLLFGCASDQILKGKNNSHVVKESTTIPQENVISPIESNSIWFWIIWAVLMVGTSYYIWNWLSQDEEEASSKEE